MKIIMNDEDYLTLLEDIQRWNIIDGPRYQDSVLNYVEDDPSQPKGTARIER
jgi:hypothetical protein